MDDQHHGKDDLKRAHVGTDQPSSTSSDQYDINRGSKSLPQDSLPLQSHMLTAAALADVPLLPSQLLESYSAASAPSQLFTEQRPIAESEVEPIADGSWIQNIPAPQRQFSFPEIANDMINKSLGRNPGGTSVVEPDSILGESGRLYHGYKDGKYLLPNDAVSLSSGNE